MFGNTLIYFRRIVVSILLLISIVAIIYLNDGIDLNFKIDADCKIRANARKLLNEAQSLNHHINAHTLSYKCTREEMITQMERIDYFSNSICDTETPWELAQLLYPDANVFIDVGGNVGYTAAQIFALWSPGHKLNRMKLRDFTKQDFDAKIFENKDNLNTYCRDGDNQDISLLCRGRRMVKQCNYKRPIQVYSFDGQKMHIDNTRGVYYRHFPELNPNNTFDKNPGNVKASWEYIFSAVTTNTGNETMGYFEIVTHEGGHLRHGQKGILKID